MNKFMNGVFGILLMAAVGAMPLHGMKSKAKKVEAPIERVTKGVSLLEQIIEQAQLVVQAEDLTSISHAQKKLTTLMGSKELDVKIKDVIKDDVEIIKQTDTNRQALKEAYERLVNAAKQIEAQANVVAAIEEGAELVKNAPVEEKQEAINVAQEKIKEAQEEQGWLQYLYTGAKRVITAPVNYVFGEESSKAKTAFYTTVGMAVLAAGAYGVSQPGAEPEKEKEHPILPPMNNKNNKVKIELPIVKNETAPLGETIVPQKNENEVVGDLANTVAGGGETNEPQETIITPPSEADLEKKKLLDELKKEFLIVQIDQIDFGLASLQVFYQTKNKAQKHQELEDAKNRIKQLSLKLEALEQEGKISKEDIAQLFAENESADALLKKQQELDALEERRFVIPKEDSIQIDSPSFEIVAGSTRKIYSLSKFDIKFFMAWLTGDYYPVCSKVWNNDEEQLKDVPDFIEKLKMADDNDVVIIRAMGIGSKGNLFWTLDHSKENTINYLRKKGSSVIKDDYIPFWQTPNLKCDSYTYGGYWYYVGELSLTVQEAKKLVESPLVGEIIESNECAPEVGRWKKKQPWAQALMKYRNIKNNDEATRQLAVEYREALEDLKIAEEELKIQRIKNQYLNKRQELTQQHLRKRMIDKKAKLESMEDRVRGWIKKLEMSKEDFDKLWMSTDLNANQSARIEQLRVMENVLKEPVKSVVYKKSLISDLTDKYLMTHRTVKENQVEYDKDSTTQLLLAKYKEIEKDSYDSLFYADEPYGILSADERVEVIKKSKAEAERIIESGEEWLTPELKEEIRVWKVGLYQPDDME